MWLSDLFEWDSLTGINRLQREMNRLFENFSANAYEAYPPMNIWSNDSEVIINAELPGVDPAEIDISVQGAQLTIQGQRKLNEMAEGAISHRRERGGGRFVRTIRLPYEADESKVKASYKNGVLAITVPRSEQSKPKKISISAE